MSLYRDEAVVLRTWKLGEADRIISMHTRNFGKIRGVAKGMRRTRSKFGARLEPAGLVSVQLYRGRGELETITQAVTVNRFVNLRSNASRFAQASAMLEAVELVAQEREPDPDRFTLLTKALATLDDNTHPLVLAGFFLKLLAHEGVGLALDECVSCGSEEELCSMDPMAGGVLCRSCRRGRTVSGETLTLMRQMLNGGLGEALQRNTDASTTAVSTLAIDAVEQHLERKLKSVAVLRSV